jgi:hypothetical protein
VAPTKAPGRECDFIKSEEEYGVYLWHFVALPAITKFVRKNRESGFNGDTMCAIGEIEVF